MKARSIILWIIAALAAAAAIYVLYVLLWLGGDFGFGGGIAKLTKSVNEVNLRAAGNIAWADSIPNADLRENDAVRTGAKSLAEITFDEGNKISLPEKSQVLIKRFRERGGKLAEGDVLIEFGGASFASTGGGESSLRLRTAGNLVVDVAGSSGAITATVESEAVLTLAGGSARLGEGENALTITAAEGSETAMEIRTGDELQVAVTRGRAVVAAGDQSVDVGENQGVALRGAAGMASGDIPSRPDTPAAPVEAGTDEMGEGASAPTLAWGASEGDPQGYRVRIVERDNAAVPVKTAMVEATNLPVSDLGPGFYLWSVRAVGKQGIDGPTSAERPLNIYDSTKFRPPTPTAPEAGVPVMYLDSPRPISFRWQAAGDNDKFRFQVARTSDFSEGGILRDSVVDGPSTEFALGEGTYYWRVAAAASEDYSGPFGEVRTMTVRKEIAPPLLVTAPKRFEVVFGTTVTLRGKTAGGNRVTASMLWSGSQSVSVGGDGAFSKQVNLRAGKNKLTITTKSAQGHVSSRVREVVSVSADLRAIPEFMSLKGRLDELNGRYYDIEKQIEDIRRGGRSSGQSAGQVGGRTRTLRSRLARIDRDIESIEIELEAYYR